MALSPTRPGATRLLAAALALMVCAACTSGKPRATRVVPTTTPTVNRAAPPAGPCAGERVSPGMDLQAAIDSHPAGTTFCFADGTYRIARKLVPRTGDTFLGSRNAILDGSVPVGGWTHANGEWVADLPAPVVPVSPYECRPKRSSACHWDGDLFVDGAHLLPVASRVALVAGTVYVDQHARRAYIAQDPTGRSVEEAVADAIFSGESGWTVDGLTLQKAANRVQYGAVEGDNITVKNAEIRLNHGVGVYGHDHSTIADNFIHDNGQMGFSGFGGPIAITGNEIAHNNKDSFEWQNEAGGGKCYKCPDVTISGNYVHDNVGPGIWCDTDCYRATIAGNLVQRNTGPGIYYEISYDAVIRDNMLMNNATDLQRDPLRVGGAIAVDTSSNVDVYANVLTDNGNGIIAIATHRGVGYYGVHALKNVRIHENTTHQTAGVIGMVNHVGSARQWSSEGNSFSDNTYFLGPNVRLFLWQGNVLSPTQWKAAGQDRTGSFETGS